LRELKQKSNAQSKGNVSTGSDSTSSKAVTQAVTASVQELLGPLEDRLKSSLLDAMWAAFAEQVLPTKDSSPGTLEAVQRVSCDLAELKGMLLGMQAVSGPVRTEGFRHHDSYNGQGRYDTPQPSGCRSQLHVQGCQCSACRSPY
jgi:hypothetical protein